MLPMSIPQIAYAKLFGCLLGLTPGIAVFYLGAIIDLPTSGDLLKEILTTPWQWVWIVHLLLFWHLVAYASLKVKWGSLPLAIAITLFGDFIVYFMFILLFLLPNAGGGISDGFMEYFLPLLFTAGQLVLTGILHLRIGAELKKQAAA